MNFFCKKPDSKYFRVCVPKGKIKDTNVSTYMTRENKYLIDKIQNTITEHNFL